MRAALVDKLRAMAHADESPFEAEIAAAKLAEAGIPVDPPRPPAPPTAAPMPFGRWFYSATTTTTSTTGWTNNSTIWVRFE